MTDDKVYLLALKNQITPDVMDVVKSAIHGSMDPLNFDLAFMRCGLIEVLNEVSLLNLVGCLNAYNPSILVHNTSNI